MSRTACRDCVSVDVCTAVSDSLLCGWSECVKVVRVNVMF